MIRHLFVPGLLGPLPEVGPDFWQPLPHLETLLARADRVAGRVGYAQGLFALFGVETPADTDLPTAALCVLAETGASPAGFVLHADPLQLVPDRDSLLAFGLDDDPLDDDEIAQLVSAFNDHFGADGLRLFGGRSGGVYLHSDQAPAIRTQSLSAVIGRDLDRFLPEGGERQHWRGLLNETQMLCHSLAFNQQREALGQPVVSGLWFSGGGELPAPGRGPVARLVGDCRLARGLMSLRPGDGDDELVVEHAPGRAVLRADPGAWLRAVGELDACLPDLLSDCEALHLHPCDGTVFRWTPRAARRWWRRRRPFSGHVQTGHTQARGPVQRGS